MNSFNGFGSFLTNAYYLIKKYIYDFPSVDASLVLYYPLDSSDGNINAGTTNYASGLPVYDASMMGSAMNTYSYVTGLGDLSLNNTMGSTATAYVKSDSSFDLVPSRGLSISLWFSCSGQLDNSGTLISLYQPSIVSSIRLGVFDSTLYSEYYVQPPPFSVTGGGVKSTTNSPNNNVNYIFTSDGTFTITVPCTIKVLLVGAGGAGGNGVRGSGNQSMSGICGGGGSGGKVLETSTISINNSTTFTVLVGSSNPIQKDGSGTYFYNSSKTISYTAEGGGYGASDYASSNGGGGSTFSQVDAMGGGVINYPTGSTNKSSFKGGDGRSYSIPSSNPNYGKLGANGGGGAGAGGIGAANTPPITSNIIVNNGGIGVKPSDYFVNNIKYGVGGPTYVSGYRILNSNTTPTISDANLWNDVLYNNINSGQQIMHAPNNTGFGGIGGGWYMTLNTTTYTTYAGKGGSGICIVSIISIV